MVVLPAPNPERSLPPSLPISSSSEDGDHGPWWTGRGWQTSLWVALIIGFSPVLLDLAQHWLAQPWSRVSLVFPALVWIASQRDTVRPGPKTWGWGLVLAGIVIELAAIGGDVVRMGRVGLVAASIGLCFAGGWASVRVALLLLWSTPLPASLMNVMSPGPEKIVAGLATTVVSLFSSGIERVEGGLVAAGKVFEFVPADLGLPSAVALAGFGWFSALLRHTLPRDIARNAVCLGLCAFPIHGVLACVAGFALAAGVDPGLIRRGLSEFSWVGILALGFLWVFIESRWESLDRTRLESIHAASISREEKEAEA